MSSSSFAVLSVVLLHAAGQLLSPAGRCLSISTVHGGTGAGGLGAVLAPLRSTRNMLNLPGRTNMAERPSGAVCSVAWLGQGLG